MLFAKYPPGKNKGKDKLDLAEKHFCAVGLSLESDAEDQQRKNSGNCETNGIIQLDVEDAERKGEQQVAEKVLIIR